jgi:hypothetical protein
LPNSPNPAKIQISAENGWPPMIIGGQLAFLAENLKPVLSELPHAGSSLRNLPSEES